MSALRKTLSAFVSALAVCVLLFTVVEAAPRVTRSVTPMEEGGFLIRVRVTAAAEQVYALRLLDPMASIRNVYAPKGWCIVTDGEEFLARTGSEPVKGGATLEFIIHSDSDRAAYTWTAFDRMKQIGTPGTI